MEELTRVTEAWEEDGTAGDSPVRGGPFPGGKKWRDEAAHREEAARLVERFREKGKSLKAFRAWARTVQAEAAAPEGFVETWKHVARVRPRCCCCCCCCWGVPAGVSSSQVRLTPVQA